jgi:histidinol-phosphate aminotransferase
MSNFDPRKFETDGARRLAGYHAKEPVAFAPDVLKMDLNEAGTPPSPRVLEALRAALTQGGLFNWYPDSACTELRAAIGRYVGVAADHVLVTNGSNMALELIARAFLTKDDTALIVSPTYGVFGVQCELQQARIESFYFRDVFQPDFGELLAASPAKILYLVNPNNPTGVGYRHEDIEALLDRRRETLRASRPTKAIVGLAARRVASRSVPCMKPSLVVLDEAYNEFYGVSCVDLIARHPQLLVLRSFSKAFSLAGLRCGYVVAAPAVIEILERIAAPWAVSAFTQVAARAALDDLPHMRATVAEVQRASQRIVTGLTALGFEARNTCASFVLWKVRDPAAVTRALAARQVYISNKDSVPQMKGWLRLSVGTLAQADQFLNTVAELKSRLA